MKKNAILNFCKQLLKIAFPLITFPYISRVLLEENFGKYNFSLSIVRYFLLMASLGISTYAVREGSRLRGDREALTEFANEVFSINVVSATISYSLLVLSVFLVPKFRSYSVLILIQGLNIIFNTLGADWVNVIHEDYEYMTKRYITVKFISLALMFIFVKKIDDYVIYTIIVVFSEVLANVANIFYVRRYIKLKFLTPLRLRKHFKALLLLLVIDVAGTVYSNADITMLGFYKGDEYVGIYTLASKIYSIAKGLITAVFVVIIPRLAYYLGSEGSEEKYSALLNKVLKCNLLITLPMSVGIMFLSKEAILILGGPNYLSGTPVLALLSFAIIPVSITTVYYSGILVPMRGEKYCLLSTAICALVNVIINYILIQRIDMLGAAIATFFVEILSLLLGMYFAYSKYSVKIRLDKDTVSALVATAGLCIVCGLATCFTEGVIKIAVSIVLGGSTYFAVLYTMKNTILFEGLQFLRAGWDKVKKKLA